MYSPHLTLLSHCMAVIPIARKMLFLFLFLGSDIKVCKLVELSTVSGEKCVIIGTLFLDQRLKPSILKDISEEVT